jgi:5-methylcytosine-specific restriction endonuclease McrA
MTWGSIKRDKADDAFSKWIRLRDRKCKRCLKTGSGPLGITGLQASHFQGRRKENTRFDPENVDALCAGCHQYFTSNPGDHYMWQVQTKGQKAVEDIVLRSNMYKKRDRILEKIYWEDRLKKDHK